MFLYWFHVFFFKIENNMISLLVIISSVKPPLCFSLCCYGLGSSVMTAFTHNVCALFCKSVVVGVCLLLMYIHYEPCLRHSMSL